MEASLVETELEIADTAARLEANPKNQPFIDKMAKLKEEQEEGRNRSAACRTLTFATGGGLSGSSSSTAKKRRSDRRSGTTGKRKKTCSCWSNHWTNKWSSISRDLTPSKMKGRSSVTKKSSSMQQTIMGSRLGPSKCRPRLTTCRAGSRQSSQVEDCHKKSASTNPRSRSISLTSKLPSEDWQ